MKIFSIAGSNNHAIAEVDPATQIEKKLIKLFLYKLSSVVIKQCFKYIAFSF